MDRLRSTLLFSLAMVAGLSLVALGEPRSGRTEGAGALDRDTVQAFLDGYLPSEMEQSRVPGVAVVIVQDGEVLVSRGFGLADVAQQVPVSPEATLFQVGSLSKLITTLAALQIVERGDMRLDEDVNRYLSEFQIDTPFREPITLAHLLSHTAGLEFLFIGSAVRTTAEIQPLATYLKTSFPPAFAPPGKVIAYSNHGVTLVGYLVEERSGQAFAEHVRQNVLLPLDMPRSGFFQTEEPPVGMAVGYGFRRGRFEAMPADFLQIAPAGSFCTSAEEMAHFLIAILEEGRFRGTRVLSEELALRMTTRQFGPHPLLPGFCLGLYEHFQGGQVVLRHSGVRAGYAAAVLVAPERELALFVAANATQPSLCEQLLARFTDQFPGGLAAPAPSLLGTTAAAASPDPVEGLAGRYRRMDWSRNRIEKLANLTREIQITGIDGDSFELRPSGGRWRRVEPLVFTEGGEHMIFERNADGAIDRFFVQRRSYEKTPWYETTALHRILFAVFGGAFLSALWWWPIGPLWSALARSRRTAVGGRAPLFAGLLGLSNAVFLAGLFTTLYKYPVFEFSYGIPSMLRTVLWLPIASTALLAVVAVSCVGAWRQTRWSLPARLHYTLIALSGAAFLPLLAYWNLLGFRY